MANSVWMLGDSLEARALAQHALNIAESLGDFSLAIGAVYYLGQVLLTLGDYRQAEEFGRSVAGSLVGDLARESFGLGRFPAVIVRGWLAWALAERGLFDEGIAYGSEAVQLGEEIGQPFSLTWAYWGLAQPYTIQGNHQEALRCIERATAVSSAASLSVWPTFLAWRRGHLYARSRRAAEGISLLREAFTAREGQRLSNWSSLIATDLGEASVAAGHIEEARDAAAQALKLARRRSERGHEAYALRLLGEIASHTATPDVETAQGHYRNALMLADELGMRPLVAHCHLGLGTLYRRIGKREPAQEHLTTATTMYREMGMTFWLEKAEAALGPPPRSAP
jgi:tetratricopeptide (TPR) repeat protein